MEALNLTKNESPQVCLKRFCLHTNCWLLNLKIFRTTFFQSTSQQLKAANRVKKRKDRTKKTTTNEQQHKKSSRISLPTHPIFLMDFFTCSLTVPTFKDMFCMHSSRLLRLCHLLYAIVFFELLAAISFSIAFAL